MGNRTTTICDGAGCTAEHDNPVSHGGSAVLARQVPGWGTLHASDEKTNLPCSYDLCPTCVQKIVDALGLKTAEELFRERDEQFRTELLTRTEPSPEPIVPPKTCETCKEPYVGDSCYFCPPALTEPKLEDAP